MEKLLKKKSSFSNFPTFLSTGKFLRFLEMEIPLAFWILYLSIGALAGFLAGLFGVGGGLIIVPLLAWALEHQNTLPDVIMPICLGTSLASILFTSLSSVRAHHQRRAVLWPAVIRIVPGILMGTFAGSYLASKLSSLNLKIFFVLFLFYASFKMFIGTKPEAGRNLPGGLGLSAMGSLIGAVSALVGIGGGTLTVPFLIWCRQSPHLAIGTSAALGFPIAFSGALGYFIHGWDLFGLPPYSAGYIYLPALFGIVFTSILTAPFGAWLSHQMPVSKVKKSFALLLALLGLRMLYSLSLG